MQSVGKKIQIHMIKQLTAHHMMTRIIGSIFAATGEYALYKNKPTGTTINRIVFYAFNNNNNNNDNGNSTQAILSIT